MNFEEFVRKNGREVKIPRKEYVFMQGDKSGSLYLVKNGLLKAYYISEDGKEFIKSFLSAGDVIGSLTAAYSKKHCSFNLICLQDTELVELEFEDIYRYIADYPKASKEVVDMLLNFSMKKERREFELLCLSPEERYKLFMERSPEIVKSVTQNDISRYLGITPVALSRIRKRMSL